MESSKFHVLFNVPKNSYDIYLSLRGDISLLSIFSFDVAFKYSQVRLIFKRRFSLLLLWFISLNEIDYVYVRIFSFK